MDVQIQKRWSTDQLITGIEAGDWLRLLGRNRFRVDPTYLHRAAWVGGLSVGSSLLGLLEEARYARQLAAVEVDPAPLFVLGHWRSGTTHMHNLLGRMPGNTYSTVFQCIFPNSFLTTAGIVPPLTARFMDPTRSYDNVKHGWGEAGEDEIALAKLTGLSPYVAFMFPDSAESYERYVDFRGCSTEERERWKQAFVQFLKKIMLQTGGKRVVVKSCTHTARIPLLLEMFPNARFVHIHRNPYEVFASTLHMRSHTDWENFFHLPAQGVEAVRREQTLRLGQRLFERVIEDRELIPAGQYVELAYEDLCGREVEVMQRLYADLGLPGWDEALPVLRDYVAGLEGYKRNELVFDQRTKDEVFDRWRVAFDAFGYAR
jgi:hypothetical protein